MRRRSGLALTTERLLIHTPPPEAAPRMVSYFEANRAHLGPWEPPLPDGVFTSKFWERRLAQNIEEYLEGVSMRLVLRGRAEPDGPVLGLCNFSQFVRGSFMCCTLGYSLDQDAQGRGVMSEALSRAIRHVFEHLGMHRVQANYMPVNERSGRVLRRLGFVVEGYARDYLYIDGAWRDHVLTSLTNPAGRPAEYLMKVEKR